MRQFEENELKTHGSIRSYGEAVLPKSHGTDSTTLQCTAPQDELYEGLDDVERERAAAAEQYLLHRSLEEVAVY